MCDNLNYSEEDIKNMNFQMRKFLLKYEVYKGVTESNEISNIKATNDTGFYSIAIINKHLFPNSLKYFVSLELIINREYVKPIWIDLMTDKVYEGEVIDFSRIKDVGRLQMMAHEVQSEGAIKSYLRRYSLTIAIGLQSTDLIDGNYKGNKNDKNNLNKGKTNNFSSNKAISTKQINFLKARINDSNKFRNQEEGLKLVEEKFKKKHTELTNNELNDFIEFLKSMKVEVEETKIEDLQKEIKNLALQKLKEKEKIVEFIKNNTGEEQKFSDIKNSKILYQMKSELNKIK